MDRLGDVRAYPHPFVSERPFPAVDGTTLRLWGASNETAAAEHADNGLTHYLQLARVSDAYYDLLGETQGAHERRPDAAHERRPDLPHAPRVDVPQQPRLDGPTARPRSQVGSKLRSALGAPVGDDAALRRWKEARRADLGGIVGRKLTHTHILHTLNNQMAGRYKSTTKSLADFDKASHAAARRPGYFQHSMRNLVVQCESYGDLVGRQIAQVRKMKDQNAAITRAGGARPQTPSVPGQASTVVSGPLSANVEQADAEQQVGAFELQATRTQLSQAISTLRDAVDSMKRGLDVAKQVGDGKGREDLGTPRGIRQKDVIAEGGVGEHGADRKHFHLEGEEIAVGRLQSQLAKLQQGYDELGFL